jgi:hypothetical protein
VCDESSRVDGYQESAAGEPWPGTFSLWPVGCPRRDSRSHESTGVYWKPIYNILENQGADKAAFQQTVLQQLRNPLAIANVSSTSRHRLQMLSIDLFRRARSVSCATRPDTGRKLVEERSAP